MLDGCDFSTVALPRYPHLIMVVAVGPGLYWISSFHFDGIACVFRRYFHSKLKTTSCDNDASPYRFQGRCAVCTYHV